MLKHTCVLGGDSRSTLVEIAGSFNGQQDVIARLDCDAIFDDMIARADLTSHFRWPVFYVPFHAMQSQDSRSINRQNSDILRYEPRFQGCMNKSGTSSY